MTFVRLIGEGIHQDDDDFYEMLLPFRDGQLPLPNNHQIAERRVNQLKSRFTGNAKYLEDYKVFMQRMQKRLPKETTLTWFGISLTMGFTTQENLIRFELCFIAARGSKELRSTAVSFLDPT